MCQACFGCWRAGRHWFNLAWFGHFRGPHVRKRGRRMVVAAAGGVGGGGGRTLQLCRPTTHDVEPCDAASREEALDMRPGTSSRYGPPHFAAASAEQSCCSEAR